MAMPENQLTPEPVLGEYLSPDDRLRSSRLVDYELGGIAIGDPSQGLDVRVWQARVAVGVIQTKPEGSGDWYDITSGAAISEISLAFDQNMRPCVAFVDAGVASFYWYDPTAINFVTSTFPGATSPMCCMDDKRRMEVGANDVLLFYLLSGRLMHRRQRDRYLIEYDLAPIPTDMTRIKRVGMTQANRIQISFE